MSALDPKEAEAAMGLLASLEMHLEYLKRKARPAWLDDIPSANQAFIYVPDATGDIVTQQDAAFVCENIIVIPPESLEFQKYDTVSLSGTTDLRSFLALSISEASTGRNITESVFKTAVQPNITVPQILTLDTQGSAWFPTWALTPLGAPGNPSFHLVNTDAYQMLSAEWLLPRGAVVRSRYFDRFNTTDSTLANYQAVPKIILLGRKVYG